MQTKNSIIEKGAVDILHNGYDDAYFFGVEFEFDKVLEMLKTMEPR